MSGCCGLKICNTRLTIWLSAKRCVCNGWLGCAENKRCLIFCLFVCLECGLNVCENERGYSWNNSSRNFEAVWEICLIKCDFTAEIQPRKTDSGTEPVSVGVVWLTKTRKRYIYHICYVHERSFYKIVHASEKAYRTLFDRTSSVSQYETRTFDSGQSVSQYETRTFDSGQSAALKRFNQFLLRYQNLLLLKFCRNSITSDYLTSCERKTKHYKFTLVNKHEGTAWHFPVTVDLNGVEGIVCCEHRKVCRNYCREAAVRSFLRSDHNFAPFILWNQLVNSYLDDLLC